LTSERPRTLLRESRDETEPDDLCVGFLPENSIIDADAELYFAHEAETEENSNPLTILKPSAYTAENAQLFKRLPSTLAQEHFEFFLQFLQLSGTVQLRGNSVKCFRPGTWSQSALDHTVTRT
jgi:hypothetical protein